jgi:hypothetical protein
MLQVHLATNGVELTMLVVIGTDCTSNIRSRPPPTQAKNLIQISQVVL